jgi:hypothetical protein
MMMTTLLSKSIRDAQGRLHKRDERLTIVSPMASRGLRYTTVAESAIRGWFDRSCFLRRSRALIREMGAKQ